MNKINLEQDIQPLSEFRSNVSLYLSKIRETKRPLVITQNGKSTAVVLDVVEYQQMIDRLELLEDIKAAEAEIGRGEVLANEDVKKKFRG